MEHRAWMMSLAVVAAACAGCAERTGGGGPVHVSGDEAFGTLAGDILSDYFQRNPTTATDLGIHRYDDVLDDFSAAGVAAEVAALRGFQARLEQIDPSGLSLDNQLDWEQLRHSISAELLQDEVIRPWARDPDTYSSGLTNAAYVLIKRTFAPPEERLRRLTARLRAMPAALAEAHKNLENPPRVYTEVAIEQIDGNRAFFETAVPQAFAGVSDRVLLGEFQQANAAVLSALADYKGWLQHDLLPRSNGEFAYGADTYRKRLWAEEMIDTPLEALLTMAQDDLKRNQAAFAQTARRINPAKTAREVLAGLQHKHPPADRLLATTQNELDALASFMRDHHIVTVPAAAAARVKETPPFMRATTSASMDIPGPFETSASEAYYNMTLPDPAWPAAEQEAFMEQWYYPAITNVSVHEVWPGHYLQFLYAKQFPSDVRKVFGAASNAEGWAHYAEQMVIDEGFHADDPSYRLAQLQDALLRDVRFIVGIRMHTQGMSVAEAERLFETEAYEPAPVAKAEAKRGTSDATYGYYTMGKLLIQQLRDDYKAKQGSAYTLLGFHDAFVKIGPLPIPLMRRALLGTDPTLTR